MRLVGTHGLIYNPAEDVSKIVDPGQDSGAKEKKREYHQFQQPGNWRFQNFPVLMQFGVKRTKLAKIGATSTRIDTVRVKKRRSNVSCHAR